MYFLVQWNRALFERMLQICILVAAVAALEGGKLVVFDKNSDKTDFELERLLVLRPQTSTTGNRWRRPASEGLA